ncbi:MAG: CDP-diacylglycerol--glycerol-3-phosphate 3-phosphatidyltransferase [Aeromicrobium sp.]
MAAATQPSNWNIANALTVVRIAGVPVFGWLLLTEGGDSVGFRLASWVAFALLMITDRIDGDLARKYDLVTNFGKLADPIADKALTGMAFVGLSIIFESWLFWTITILVLVREWGITLMRFVIKKYGVMPASQGGKIKTTLQAFAIGGFLLPFEIWNNPLTDLLLFVTWIVMAAAVIVTVVTGVMYVRDARTIRREAKAATPS